jgi:hypothetical protein
LHEPWTLGGIAQRVAQAVDGSIDAVVYIYKGVRRPKFFPELFPGDDLTWMFEQKSEDLKRLLLEFDLHPLLAQLAGMQVHLKDSKSQYA